MKRSTPTATDDQKRIAFFAACCLLFSTIEWLIPKPAPFLRIGLANVPILLALRIMPWPHLLLLILLKVLGQALLHGSLFSYVFLFSLAGSLAGGLVMLACSRISGRRISLIGISIMGALASNTAQIAIAVWLLFGGGGWLMAAPLLAVGLITSILLGVFAEQFQARSRWLALVSGPTSAP